MTRRPKVGDWVELTHIHPVGIGETLAGTGLPIGTRGVVTSIRSGRAQVTVDMGLSTSSLNIPASRLRVHRREGGENAFIRRTSVRTTVRAAAMLALVAPLVLYWVQYVWINHSAEGVVASMTEGAILSTLDLMALAITAPGQTAIYLLAGWLVLYLTRIR